MISSAPETNGSQALGKTHVAEQKNQVERRVWKDRKEPDLAWSRRPPGSLGTLSS